MQVERSTLDPQELRNVYASAPAFALATPTRPCIMRPSHHPAARIQTQHTTSPCETARPERAGPGSRDHARPRTSSSAGSYGARTPHVPSRCPERAQARCAPC